MFTRTIPRTPLRRASSIMLWLSAIVLILILTACGGGAQATNQPSSTPASSGNLPVVALSSYQVSLFASATSAYSHPDSVVADNGHIFIGYQNLAAKDGSDNKTSTIVEYTMDGKVVKTFDVPGHNDGLRVDPSTHLVWATDNEDANPNLVTIDPTNGTMTKYTFPKTPHGGGYDDMYFLNGMTFLVASNPSLDKSGANTAPALDKITLSGSSVMLTPVLMGNATATDTISKSKVTLNEIDPDSLTVDTSGDLVLINQAGTEVVYIKNPGTPQQQVSRTPVGTQLDDTVWATSAKGRLLVTDGNRNQTYWIRTTFVVGSVYTQTPDDSTVAGLVGQLDPSTGILTPVAIGFGKATGMLFVPD